METKNEQRSSIDLNGDFKACMEWLENSREPLFITGKAGTGKSTLLQHFRQNTKKNVVVVAPTGVAALNVAGQTIHSFFGFPSRMLEPKDIRKKYYTKIYEKLDTLVIDEISMVRAEMLDNIDYFLRLNRNRPTEPFGGVRVVFFGDLFQLPPVIATPEEREFFQTVYESAYFFSAKIFKQLNLRMIELKQVYRQTDRHFIQLLDAVRQNRVDYDELADLNERHDPEFADTDSYITLSARNATVLALNKSKLDSLSAVEETFIGTLTGDFTETNTPAELILKLKVGAQVMFVRNDPDRRFVNGTIGKIVALSYDSIRVAIRNVDDTQTVIDVEKAKWESFKYKLNAQNVIEAEVTGSYTQYPLKLAWAITIHKSQGKTFDRVIIDLGRGAFEHGQTYVALSRCRTLSGIVLKQALTPRDIMTDERVVEFYEQNQ